MRKLIVSLVAAVLSLAAGAALAQGDGTGARGPGYGPVPGTPEYYGNSGGSIEGMAPPSCRPPLTMGTAHSFVWLFATIGRLIHMSGPGGRPGPR